MRKNLIPVALLLAVALPRAETPKPSGYHRHDGFFLSMSLGGGPFGSNFRVHDLPEGGASTWKANGGGFHEEFKVGWAWNDRWALSLDGIGALSFNDPADTTVNANVMMIGVGATYFVMPANVFVTTTFGFALADADSSADWTRAHSVSAANSGAPLVGPAFQLKVGKEWWVSDNWGLGVSAYWLTAGASSPEQVIQGVWYPASKFDVNTAGLAFSATYN